MSIFEHMTWGLGTPNLPKLGARAILQRGYVDFLGDRAGMYGEPDEAWRAECDELLSNLVYGVRRHSCLTPPGPVLRP